MHISTTGSFLSALTNDFKTFNGRIDSFMALFPSGYKVIIHEIINPLDYNDNVELSYDANEALQKMASSYHNIKMVQNGKLKLDEDNLSEEEYMVKTAKEGIETFIRFYNRLESLNGKLANPYTGNIL